jgi:hypothetical protein
VLAKTPLGSGGEAHGRGADGRREVDDEVLCGVRGSVGAAACPADENPFRRASGCAALQSRQRENRIADHQGQLCNARGGCCLASTVGRAIRRGVRIGIVIPQGVTSRTRSPLHPVGVVPPLAVKGEDRAAGCWGILSRRDEC